jgi:hypothetical protein
MISLLDSGISIRNLLAFLASKTSGTARYRLREMRYLLVEMTRQTSP